MAVYFAGEYRLVTAVDVSALQADVDLLTEADWNADPSRQAAFAPHRKTQSIGLIYDPDMRHENPTVRPVYERFRQSVEPIMSVIADTFGVPKVEAGEPYYIRAILVRLAARESIGTHRDFGPSLSRAHRIHVPIRTNEGAEFGIAGVIRHLPAGEAWEINNRVAHAVRNNTDEARVHLILDYVIPGEIIPDPDGDLLG
jgi:hypothetical protein